MSTKERWAAFGKWAFASLAGHRKMKHFTTKLMVIIFALGISGSSVYIWSRTVSNYQVEQESSQLPPYPYHIHVTWHGRPVTLQEAREKMTFEIFAPKYLPSGISLARVEIEEFGESTYNIVHLFYSNDRVTNVTLNPFAYGAAKLIVTVHRWNAVPPDDKWFDSYINSNPKIYRDVRIGKVRGYGIDLGHVNRYEGGLEEPIPACVNWWDKELKFSIISSTYPLEELIKIAESMANLTSIYPSDELSRIPEL